MHQQSESGMKNIKNQIINSQTATTICSDPPEIDDRDPYFLEDCTIVEVPTECVGFVTGTNGNFLRSVEQEFGTIAQGYASARQWSPAANDSEVYISTGE